MQHVYGLNIPTSLADLVEPKSCALLVYDMQVGICRQIADGNRVVERCAAALAAARRAGMRVVFTRHLSCPKTWMGATQYRSAMAWQKTDDPALVKPWFLRDAAASSIVPELQPTADELVLDKLAMSAFEGTPLSFALQDCGIRGVAICGIALEIGIEPTVRHATDLGFIPIVLQDACGSGHAEAGARSLATMRFVGEALLTEVADFVRLLGNLVP
jgi:nicotinamidase-related amidase